MQTEYDYVIANNAPVPHMAVVWGSKTSDPGDVVFTVELVDNVELVELAVMKLVDTANAAGGALLDGLIGHEVVHLDLPSITAEVAMGLEPFLRPVRFTPDDLELAYKALFNGGPSNLSEFSATMAIKDLMTNWKASLAEGGAIGNVVSDVDDVIQHLKAFKTLCSEKPVQLNPEDYRDVIESTREVVADKLFESHAFKWQIESSDHGWKRDGDTRLMKIAKASDGEFTARLVFHVVFYPNSILVEECFALDLDTGMFF